MQYNRHPYMNIFTFGGLNFKDDWLTSKILCDTRNHGLLNTYCRNMSEQVVKPDRLIE